MQFLKLLGSAKLLIIVGLIGAIGCSSCKEGRKEPTLIGHYNDVVTRRLLIENTCKILCNGASGTGTLVYDNVVITANHVVVDNELGHQVDIIDNEDDLTLGWLVSYSDPTNDIAILQRSGTSSRGSRRWLGWSTDISEGTFILVSGYPWGVGPILTDGYISKISSGSTYFWTSANALPGSSGSGVYNNRGEFVGILVRGVIRFGNWSQFTFHAVPIGRISNRLNSLNLD